MGTQLEHQQTPPRVGAPAATKTAETDTQSTCIAYYVDGTKATLRQFDSADARRQVLRGELYQQGETQLILTATQ